MLSKTPEEMNANTAEAFSLMEEGTTGGEI